MNKHRLRMLHTALLLLREEAGALGCWVTWELMPAPTEEVLHYLGNADTIALFTDLDDALGVYLAARNDYADFEDMNVACATFVRSQDTFLAMTEADEKAEAGAKKEAT